jgi:gliding motility-associated-like protein
MKNRLFIIVLVVFTFCISSFAQVVYEEDFDTDPNFFLYEPDHAYWDAAAENFWIETFDDDIGKYWAVSPEFETLNTLCNYTIEFDMLCEHADWGTYPGISFSDGLNQEQYGEQVGLRIHFSWTNTNFKKIYFATWNSSGQKESWASEKSFEEGVWYRFLINYKGENKRADIEIYDLNKDELFEEYLDIDFDTKNIESFGIGYYNQTGIYGDEWSPIRVDNFKFTITSEDINTFENIFICEGESYNFNGIELSEEGMYCNTMNLTACTDSIHCIEISYYEIQDLQIYADQSTIISGDSTQLFVEGNFDEVQWFSSPSISCLDCSDPYVFPTETTTYYVDVYDQNSCVRSDSITITVNPSCDLESIVFPNAFTPDNNGLNDYFRAVSPVAEPGFMELWVFNRWGEVVFHSTDKSGWDGTIDDSIAPSDVYIYMAEVSCQTGPKRFYKGEFLLLR